MGQKNKLVWERSRDSIPQLTDESVPFTQLVASKQYSQIIEKLDQVGRLLEDPIMSTLFALARQLCVICQQGEATVALHRHTLAEVVVSQETYQEQLVEVFKTLSFLSVPTSIPVKQKASEAHSPKPIQQTQKMVAPSGVPTLAVYMLGEFRLYQDEKLVRNWANGKGKAIFKYLLLHRHQPVAREVLMEQFWPDSVPDLARNNLNVAIYGLRKALRNDYEGFSHILFQDNAYRLNPEMVIWIDAEDFEFQVKEANRLEQQGTWETAVSVYQTAEALYQGAFLEDDRYEEWIDDHRYHLQTQHVHVLKRLSHYYFTQELYSHCIAVCQKILAADGCCEEAHRWLMTSYYQQGQRHLALRQYHRCQTALANDLDVEPMPETVDLYEQIRSLESVQASFRKMH